LSKKLTSEHTKKAKIFNQFLLKQKIKRKEWKRMNKKWKRMNKKWKRMNKKPLK